MGNQASNSSGGNNLPASSSAATAGSVRGEPLESYLREKQRDEHLKNLGFKRSKSLRKSISKRLRRRHKNKKEEEQPGHQDEEVPPSQEEQQQQQHRGSSKQDSSQRSKDRHPSVERLDIGDYPEPKRRTKPLVGEPQPMPNHVQELNANRSSSTVRKMDRLRKSLRSSLRRKRKDRDGGGGETSTTDGGGSKGAASGDHGGKPTQWQADEIGVRSGTCSFHVKYLGCVEVFESRGMQVCEEAVRVLKNSKRKSVRTILYVHGDGLRVVDDDTKGLIVDQTIEKVSFCAPDRNFEKGFSYICRDGTTRRWMCHGFLAVKETGERLSHAVGCAFAICLEKKQQRDKLCTVSMTFDQSNSSFTRYGSFRQASITERLQDPQVLKPSLDPIPLVPVENPYAVARPHATDSMIQRQTSFRGFKQLHASGNSPFKRQLSLRLDELPSTLARQQESGLAMVSPGGLDNSGLVDKDVGRLGASPSGVLPVQLLKSQLSQLYQESEKKSRKFSEANQFVENKFDAIAEAEDEASEISTAMEDPISTMCKQLSQELYLLSSRKNINEKDQVSNSTQSQQCSIPSSTIPLPSVPEGRDEYSPIEVEYSLHHSADVTADAAASSSTTTDPLADIKPVRYDNPWDFVPDQPSKVALPTTTTAAAASASNCDSSSGISSLSGHSTSGNHCPPVFSSPTCGGDADWFGAKTNGLSTVVGEGGGDSDRNRDELWSLSESAIMDDPFDAEWAALATRNNSKNVTNPFSEERLRHLGKEISTEQNIKAFELQM